MKNTFVGCAAENFRTGRRGFRPEAIVIHIVVGTMVAADSTFADPREQKSAHYCVGKDGTIHQYVDEADTAFHAGTVVNPTAKIATTTHPGVNPNLYTIGIEHAGLPTDTWPEAQVQASGTLVAEIAARWRIPLDSNHVIRHHEIRANKTCPGKGDVARIISIAQATAIRAAQPLTQITAVSNVNVRVGAPSTTAPIWRLISKGALISVQPFVTGEAIRGNSFWYPVGSGRFIWAGATDWPFPLAR